MKLVVVGIDGAHWELIQPWIQDGSLPNIEKIIQSGVCGDMLSCLPPVTLPNWKCYSTGKNPGKIGIFWWENVDFEQGRIYHPFNRKFDNLEIWDYLGRTGLKVGVVGVPGTYPPRKVNGFMIAGGPDAGDEGYTYPKELEGIIKNDYGYKLRPQTLININEEKAAKEIQNIIDVKFNVGKMLANVYQVDFLQITSFEINTLQHFLWDDEKTKESWKTIDNHLDYFLKNKENNIILVSDHGSNKIESVFNINVWLEKHGYLNVASKGTFYTKILKTLHLNREILLKLVYKLKITELIKKIPKNLINKIPKKSGEVTKQGDMIDWKKSKVVASGQGPVYVKSSILERDKQMTQLKKELEAVTDPSTGKKIIKKAYFKEEIYNGKYLDEAPDLILDQEKGVHIPGGIGMRDVFSNPKNWRAENKKWGLFAAYGPDIKSSEKKIDISILDLAPTILHMFNIPTPQEMDGSVLREIFHEQSEIAKRALKK